MVLLVVLMAEFMSVMVVVLMIVVVVVGVELCRQRNDNNLDTTDPICTSRRQNPILELQHTHVLMLNSANAGHHGDVRLCKCAHFERKGKGKLRGKEKDERS
jgi:hypothetical protein